MAQGRCLPNPLALLAPRTGSPTSTFPCVFSWSLSLPKWYQLARNTESRKVPGRESRGFRKISLKGIFMNIVTKE